MSIDSATTTAAAEEATAKNSMSHSESYRATRWVEENQASLEGLTQDKAAGVIAAGTGLTVTVSNVRAIAATLNITIGRTPKIKKGASYSRDVSRTLARAVLELYNGLGQTPSEALKAIAAR